MKIAVTPADQAVARLDVLLAQQLGEDVDPRVKFIAEADFAVPEHDDERLPDAPSSNVVYLDDTTGEVVAVGVGHRLLAAQRQELGQARTPRVPQPRAPFIPEQRRADQPQTERSNPAR